MSGKRFQAAVTFSIKLSVSSFNGTLMICCAIAYIYGNMNVENDGMKSKITNLEESNTMLRR
jgi:hypothetical protein